MIGPIFTQSIQAIESDVSRNGITLLSLSNNHELIDKTGEDGGIFISGIMLEQQIDSLVTYAIEQKKTNFAIIAPSNFYGTTVATIFKKIVRSRDGKFITSEFYESSDKDMEKAVSRLINAYSVSSDLAEGSENKPEKDFILKDSDRFYPQIIMIPDSEKNASKIAALIKKLNKEEREFQIIGTNQWDDQLASNSKDLFGAWFASPESFKFKAFEKAYRDSYNNSPPRIASIVYDLVSITSSLINLKSGRELNIKDFTSYSASPENGFDGIDGLFRFLPNGYVQRNLAVLQIDRDQFLTIKKPAEKFLKY